MAATVEVDGLRIEVTQTGAEIVDDLSFSIAQGEIVGLVGESGSGKTTVALALLGHARRGTRIARGGVRVAGIELTRADPSELRDLRGKIVSYVPQDPSAALDPSLRVERQLAEVLESHHAEVSSAGQRDRIRAALQSARLPSDDEFLRRYPHQISGGQQQRVCIAMAFLLQPRLIVLDEPTTGLDVTTQAHVLELVRDLCHSTGAAALYVSHDLAAVGSLAERAMVMYAGRLVERGPTAAIFARPGHPYTRKLIAAIPDVDSARVLQSIPGSVPPPGERGIGCVFAPRCTFAMEACTREEPPAFEFGTTHTVLCVRARELGRPVLEVAQRASIEEDGRAVQLSVRDVNAFHGERQILSDLSFQVRATECMALVGESGSGKTTLSRCIVGLHSAWSGEIRLGSEPLAEGARDRTVEQRRKLQYVFQSPYNSLNPRRTVADIVRSPLEYFLGLRGARAEQRVRDVLDRVALTPAVMWRYPDELSGGERQRVAIARALAAEPEILICDEVTSALDASVQAAIVNLLERLQKEDKLALLFVTHNIALVRTIAQRLVVLSGGRLVEAGSPEDVIGAPTQPYTQQLLRDTPSLTRVPGEEMSETSRAGGGG